MPPDLLQHTWLLSLFRLLSLLQVQLDIIRFVLLSLRNRLVDLSQDCLLALPDDVVQLSATLSVLAVDLTYTELVFRVHPSMVSLQVDDNLGKGVDVFQALGFNFFGDERVFVLLVFALSRDGNGCSSSVFVAQELVGQSVSVEVQVVESWIADLSVRVA